MSCFEPDSFFSLFFIHTSQSSYYGPGQDLRIGEPVRQTIQRYRTVDTGSRKFNVFECGNPEKRSKNFLHQGTIPTPGEAIL